MDPRNFRTWTSLADHPIFTNRREFVADWSSDPSVYENLASFPTVFDPNWYVHINPQLPEAVQASYAARDIRNLADICAAIEDRFGPITHELFVLDDLTVYVQMKSDRLLLEIYPDHFDETGAIVNCFVDEPFEAELQIHSIADVVPSLESRLRTVDGTQ